MPDTPKAEPAQNDPLQVLAGLIGQLQPLLDNAKLSNEFHRTVSDAKKSDARLFWDVRLIRGEEELISVSKGISYIPDLLARHMHVDAPSLLHNEIIEKIARTLVTELQRGVHVVDPAVPVPALPHKSETAPPDDVEKQPTTPRVNGDKVMALAGKIGDADVPPPTPPEKEETPTEEGAKKTYAPTT